MGIKGLIFSILLLISVCPLVGQQRGAVIPGATVEDDELLGSDGDVHTISHLNLKSGQMTAQWGTPETLQLPHLMAYDEARLLYVTEVNGKRVQIFRKAQ